MKKIITLLVILMSGLPITAQWTQSGQTIRTSSNEIILNGSNKQTSTLWLNSSGSGPTKVNGHYYIKAFDYWGSYLHFAGTGDDGNERMTVTFDGKVGVGTTDPKTELHIKSQKPVLRIGSSQKAEGYIGDLGSIVFTKHYDLNEVAKICAKTRGAEYAYRRSDLVFSTSNNDKLYDRMLISYNGNVGIGTLTPEAKLDVNGTIRAKEIKVEANGNTADFVFEEDYNLKPLAEVESFITTNKHLPDVPSAATMEEEGVNLAEMNKLLLQKVEELTLYVIEMKKEINELKNKQK